MDTLKLILVFCISLSIGVPTGVFLAHAHSYEQGYEDGHRSGWHDGFSEGIYTERSAAAESADCYNPEHDHLTTR